MKKVSSIHGHTIHALRGIVTDKGYPGPGIITMCNKHIEQDNVDYETRKRRLCKVCWYHQTILKAPKVGKLGGMPNRVVVLDDAEGFNWDRLPKER